MARSELLASVCAPLWELRTGRRVEPPEWLARLESGFTASPLAGRIIDRLDAFAVRWHELAPGESIAVEWSLARTIGHARAARHRVAPRRRLRLAVD